MVGSKNRKRLSYTSNCLAYCDIPYGMGWTTDNYFCSWSSRRFVSPDKGSQRGCYSPVKLVHTSGPVWRKSQTKGRSQEFRVHSLLEAVDNNLERAAPCDVQKLIKSIQLRKASGVDSIPNDCLRYLARRPLVHITIPFRCHIFSLP